MMSQLTVITMHGNAFGSQVYSRRSHTLVMKGIVSEFD
jgi:hypothetical protein